MIPINSSCMFLKCASKEEKNINQKISNSFKEAKINLETKKNQTVREFHIQQIMKEKEVSEEVAAAEYDFFS